MSRLTSEEQKLRLEKKKEFKNIIIEFKNDYLSSFFIGIKKVGTVILGLLILGYFIAKLIFQWDLFYEVELSYRDIFLIITVLFIVIDFLCLGIAFILFNQKHERKTKYKN